jgi:hypothetical protein
MPFTTQDKRYPAMVVALSVVGVQVAVTELEVALVFSTDIGSGGVRSVQLVDAPPGLQSSPMHHLQAMPSK